MSKIYPEEEVRKFFKLLRHSNETEIRTIGNSGVRSYHVHGEEEFVNKCMELDGKNNVYAGIQERTHNGTTTDSVKFLRTIPFDFDPLRSPGKAAEDEKSRSNALTASFIFWNGLRSLFSNVNLIFSGDGYHVYLPIETIDIEPSNKERISKAYKILAEQLLSRFPIPSIVKTDRVWDLARIMRVPGTVNLKTGMRANFIQYLPDANPILRDTLLDIHIEEPKIEFELPERVVQNIAMAKWIDTDMSRILGGNFRGFPSRSEAEMSVVCKLTGLGFTDDEIDSIMRAHGMQKWETANPKYRTYTLKKAKEWYASNKLFKPSEQ